MYLLTSNVSYVHYSKQPSASTESPPQLPASKTSPPTTKRIPTTSSTKTNTSTTQSQTNISNNDKATTSSAQQQHQQASVENTLDNQPIPKLITTNESVHYAYASSYAAMYGHHSQEFHSMNQQPMPPHSVPIVPSNNMYSQNHPYTQTSMPPTLQSTSLSQFQQSNPAAAYFQPPPPPQQMPNYFHHD